MKKKLFFAGLTTLFIVVIIGLVSCELEPSYDYEFVLKNRSSYTIQVDIRPGYDVNPNSFTIRPGADKKTGGNINYTTTNPFWFDWSRTDGNGTTGVRWDMSTMTFYNQ